MALKYLNSLLLYVEPCLCLIAMVAIVLRGQFRNFRALTFYLGLHATTSLVLLILLEMMSAKFSGLNPVFAYQLYFFIYWGSYLVETFLGFAIIYSVYRLAMLPLKGLQRLGVLMFRWAFGIAFAISMSVGLGPQASGMKLFVRAVTQLQRTQSVLTLCILLFVCLTIKPLGLSVKSKMFGVSLGLGLMATMNLIASAWTPKMQSPLQIACSLAVCASYAIIAGYFALPEPKRRMIVLPTTSPFLRWNQISIALGDAPGFVVINEVSPEMFAPAELEIMKRASAKMDGAAKMHALAMNS